jgi:hypothetical protein
LIFLLFTKRLIGLIQFEFKCRRRNVHVVVKNSQKKEENALAVWGVHMKRATFATRRLSQAKE